MALLIDAGADVHARDERGETPLHDAAQSGEAEGVEMLLDAGADAKARNYDGVFPVDLAKSNPNIYGTNAYWRLNDARFE